jgi:hypothetical protein
LLLRRRGHVQSATVDGVLVAAHHATPITEELPPANTIIGEVATLEICLLLSRNNEVCTEQVHFLVPIERWGKLDPVNNGLQREEGEEAGTGWIMETSAEEMWQRGVLKPQR